MSWKVNFTREGKEDLEKLGGEVRKRVFNKIEWLKNNFSQIVSLPLSNEWRGFFK